MQPQSPSLRPLGKAESEANALFDVPQIWSNARYTPARVQNMVQARAEFRRGDLVLESLPTKLTIESTNVCNLRCPACFTGAERDGRKAGHMPVELFEWLMAELGPTLFEVELHNWGEPLLGRNLYPMLEMATEAGVATTINTNFSLPFDDEQAERIVSSGLSTLGVSIDGATQPVYEQYRRRGELSLVLANCRRIADAKQRLGSPTPNFLWAYHVFSFNAHEVDEARRIAEDIGMGFSATRGWVVGEESRGVEGFRYPLEGGTPQRCFFLWHQTVVHHDGGVAPCCGTFYAGDDYHRIGLDSATLERTSFRDVWNASNFVQARRLFRDRTPNDRNRKLACMNCPATTDFERWMEAQRTGKTEEFSGSSPNEGFNFFWSRRPDQGPGLERIPEARSAIAAADADRIPGDGEGA